MQLLLLVMGFTAFLSVAILLPETSHPGTRGVDVVYANDAFKPAKERRWRWVWLNPFASVKLLRGPAVFFVVRFEVF
jgi:hypothetical protein